MAPPQAPSRLAKSPGWLADLAGAWIFYSVLPAAPWPQPRFERIARFAPWIGALLGGLEALAWGIMPLASDIPPHRELRLAQDSYFPLGDVAALSTSLVRLADRVEHHEGPTERLERMQEAARRFDWDDSARQTREVYHRATMRGSRLAASAP